MYGIKNLISLKLKQRECAILGHENAEKKVHFHLDAKRIILNNEFYVHVHIQNFDCGGEHGKMEAISKHLKRIGQSLRVYFAQHFSLKKIALFSTKMVD